MILSMTELKPIDPSTNVYQSGRFAPVDREVESSDLTVEGTVPTDLDGAFLRNGPNPKFTPLGSYTYPLEGDAMIHGVWLEGGQARYKNRWVVTKGMLAEERAGRALFGGLMTPAFVDQGLLGVDPDPGWPFKLDPFINIIRHGGRYLALGEGLPPYEVTAGLETVGLYDFDGGVTEGMGAHVRVDPASGDMVFIRYGVEAPFVTWGEIGADGRVSRQPAEVPGVDRSYMIHDFAATPHYLVLVLGPATLDVNAMLTGGDVLKWEPELGTRVALIRRDGSEPIRWFEHDTFWAWHYANAYESGRDVILDFPRSSSPGFTTGEKMAGGFTRATLGLDTGGMHLSPFGNIGCEFPRFDERRTGLRHRYVTVASRTDNAALKPGEHDRLIRYDVETGVEKVVDMEFAIGEAVFAPRTGGTEELDGYYVTFATSLTDGRSALHIWDADDLSVRARILLPQRVPNGLHASWLPSD